MSFWKNKYDSRKEIFLLLSLKVFVSLFLFSQYSSVWPIEQQNGVAMLGNDSSGYIHPLESLVHGNGYDSMCRMPAFAPIYVIFYFILGSGAVLSGIIIFQMLCSWLSAVMIYLLLRENGVPSFRSLVAAVIFILFPLFGTYDHLILSDSLGNSLLVFAIYFAWKSKQNSKLSTLLLSALCIVWSGFFRQIHFVFIPFLFWFALPALKFYSKEIFYRAFVFFIPFFLFIGSWTLHNKIKQNQWVFTVAPYETCFGYLPKPLLELRKLMIAMGGDIQPWVKGSAAEFFIGKENKIPFKANQYTSIMGETELLQLKTHYQQFYYKKDSMAGEYVSQLSNLYTNQYVLEHPVQYYVGNRLRLLAQFLFPNHVDNIPIPAFNEMTLFQKAYKVIAWVGMWFLNILALINLFLVWKYSRDWLVLAIANAGLVLLLACIFGWIELRYLLPIHTVSLILTFVSTRQIKFQKINNFHT